MGEIAGSPAHARPGRGPSLRRAAWCGARRSASLWGELRPRPCGANSGSPLVAHERGRRQRTPDARRMRRTWLRSTAMAALCAGTRRCAQVPRDAREAHPPQQLVQRRRGVTVPAESRGRSDQVAGVRATCNDPQYLHLIATHLAGPAGVVHGAGPEPRYGPSREWLGADAGPPCSMRLAPQTPVTQV